MTRGLMFKMRRSIMFLGAVLSLSAAPAAWAAGDDAGASGLAAAVQEIVNRECINLRKDRLEQLLSERVLTLPETDRSPELGRIIEGVIKRTDFDGISEEKTVEIIGLVQNAHRRGAPLDKLDDIFDVAYVKTISADQLYTAALALKEFSDSDVPQDIYEEFVYRSIEEGWDTRDTPVLVRGLIYGVDRGLSPERVALIIMLDVNNGELKNKKADQLVLDAVKLVREKEPQNWKPLTEVEREMNARLERKRSLERKITEADEQLSQRERAMATAQAELKELREYPAKQADGIDPDRVARDLEKLIRQVQGEILQAQKSQREALSELEATRKDVERQQAVRNRERNAKRSRDLAGRQQEIQKRSKQGALNKTRLVATAEQWIGTPYRFGGDSERGIDCSAFTRRVYRSQGVELPRNSRDQADIGSVVAYGGVRTGDLLFFDTSISGSISHVGVVLGGTTFAHASSSKGVTRSSLKEKYYVKRFVKGGRIFRD